MGTEAREELKAKMLEKVIYFAANLVVWVDDEKRHEDLPNLEQEMLLEKDEVERTTRSRSPSATPSSRPNSPSSRRKAPRRPS